MNNLNIQVVPTDYGYAKDGKVYLKESLGLPERLIGEVKTTEAEALQYFANRFDLIKNKVEGMLSAMEIAENKGSYLMQVMHLKETLTTFNALGPFEVLHSLLEEAEQKIKVMVEGNRVKNLELKRTLLVNAQKEFQNDDIRAAIKSMKEIRFSWITIGSTAKEVSEELEAEFTSVMERFQIIRDAYNEERNKEIEIREQKLKILLEVAKGLNTYPPEVEQSYYKMQKLEHEWKAIGNVPKAIYDPYFQEFKRIKKTITKYARKGQDRGGRGGFNRGPQPIIFPKYIPPHEVEIYENLRRRLDLIAEAEELLKMDLREANERAKDVQARWKVSGQIPDKYKSEIFNQFNAISDRIFESSYLARVVNTKYPHFRTMPAQEQLEAKIEAMDEIILKEDMNVRVTQAEFEFMSPDERTTDENRSRFSRLNTSVRKLKMKGKILNEMKRDLDRMRNPNGGGSYDRGGYGDRRPSGYGDRSSGGYGQRSGGYGDRGGSGGGYSDRNSGGGYGNRSGGSNYDRGGYQNRPTNPYGDQPSSQPPREGGYRNDRRDDDNRGGGSGSGGYRPRF